MIWSIKVEEAQEIFSTKLSDEIREDGKFWNREPNGKDGVNKFAAATSGWKGEWGTETSEDVEETASFLVSYLNNIDDQITVVPSPRPKLFLTKL